MKRLIDCFGHQFGPSGHPAGGPVGNPYASLGPWRYGPVVADFAVAASAAAIALTAGSVSWPSPCRFASQLGSLYESHVLPDASCQTNAFSGRSIPTV